MKTGSCSLSSDIQQLSSALAELCPFLLSQARRWVYSDNVPCWREQEEDVAEDIVQEAIVRTLNYIRRDGYRKTMLKSLANLSTTIARDYYLDLRRRDPQLVHFPFQAYFSSEKYVTSLDSLERSVENVSQEEFFTRLARIIVSFPDKQRIALLIDLANHACAHRSLSPLQVALSTVGIHLQDYQRPLPENPVEYSRHTCLVRLAYKRLTNLSAGLRVADEPIEANKSRGIAIPPDESDVATICNDVDLGALSERLNRTAPTITIDPAFREELRSRLLNMALEHRPVEATETEASDIAEEQSEKTLDDIPEPIDSRATTASIDEPDAATVQSEPDLAALSEHLCMTVSPSIADPAFREELRSRLLDMVLERWSNDIDGVNVDE